MYSSVKTSFEQSTQKEKINESTTHYRGYKATRIELEQIELLKYPNLLLTSKDGSFEASMNRHNRDKFDGMEQFPHLSVETYNPNHGALINSEGIEVVVYLERI